MRRRLAWTRRCRSRRLRRTGGRGHALGTKATIAAPAGKLREARELGGASVAVMRRIDRQWGAARALLGFGDMARLSGHPGEAHGRLVAALPVFERDRRAAGDRRCPGRPGRVGLDLGTTGQGRGSCWPGASSSTRPLRVPHRHQGASSRPWPPLAVLKDPPARASAASPRRPTTLRDRTRAPAAARRPCRRSTLAPPAASAAGPVAGSRRGTGPEQRSSRGPRPGSRPAAAFRPRRSHGPTLTCSRPAKGRTASPSPLTRRKKSISQPAGGRRTSSNKAMAGGCSIQPRRRRPVCRRRLRQASASPHQPGSPHRSLAARARWDAPARSGRAPPRPTADTSHGHGSPGW